VNFAEKVLYRRAARRTRDLVRVPELAAPSGPGRGWIDLVAGIRRAQQDGSLTNDTAECWWHNHRRHADQRTQSS